jgi:hypothetical protein
LLIASAVLALGALALSLIAQPAGALPEYASQTGEPCATCHISPSGGGLRTPRGQAWLAGHRPGAVPSLEEALALLGVHLTANPADFVAPVATREPAQQPAAPTAQGRELRQWLESYGGN